MHFLLHGRQAIVVERKLGTLVKEVILLMELMFEHLNDCIVNNLLNCDGIIKIRGEIQKKYS